MAQGKKHIPTDQNRKMIERLKAGGLNHAQIAYVLEINEDTLEKYYPKELKDGKSKLDAFVVGKLFNLINDNDRACIMFYLKTRCGWKESIDVNNSFTLPAIEAESIKKSDD